MAFWNKKIQNSEEYEKLSKKITELRESFEELNIRVTKIVTDISNLRGRFNQKLSGLKPDSLEVEESKGIYNSMFIPDNGTFK